MKNINRNNIINVNNAYSNFIDTDENENQYVIVFNNKEICKFEGILYYDIETYKKVFISNTYISEFDEYLTINQIKEFANRIKYSNEPIKFININDIFTEILDTPEYKDIDVLFYDKYIKLIYRHRSYTNNINIFEFIKYNKLSEFKSKLINFKEAINTFIDNDISFNKLLEEYAPSQLKTHSFLYSLHYNDVTILYKILENDIIKNISLEEISNFNKMINSLLSIYSENRFHKYKFDDSNKINKIIENFIAKGITVKTCKLYGTDKFRTINIKISYNYLLDGPISTIYLNREYTQFIIAYLKAGDVYDDLKNKINNIILHYF